MRKYFKGKYTREKPWGKFEQFIQEKKVTVKIITVNANQSLSLQYHRKRDEFWKILSGKCTVTLGDSFLEAGQGDEFFIKKKQKHRIKAHDAEVRFLELSFGRFDEQDITRIEDKYNRLNNRCF